mmetsp:Transcript_132055/g.282454  ORF Transcript_132055/g.282454 Transcript_132055/m.282454 type:complete len:288 (+) Transcript_132055:106-969(+)
MTSSKCVAPVTALVFSAVFFFIFAYAAILMKRFSPVYTPVRCINTNKTFEFTVNASGAFVVAFTTMECTNPNSFSVEIEKGSPGRVFFHPEMLDIGQVIVGKYALTEGGTSEMKADVALHIPPDDIPLLLQGEKNILEEMNVNAVASLDVLGFRIKYHFNEVNTCGFSMKTYPATMSYKTGPAICATTQHELLRIIPSIDAKPAPFEIGVGAERLEQAEQMRNAGCGTAMCLSALLGLLCLRCALMSMYADGRVVKFLRSASGLKGKTPENTAEPCPEPEKSSTNVV